MGKDLQGNELGKGISQRKDGYYTARYVDKTTNRTEQKYFWTLNECVSWVNHNRAEKKQKIEPEKQREEPKKQTQITLLEWHKIFTESLKEGNVKYRSLEGYKSDYKILKKTKIGNMPIDEIKPMDIQATISQLLKTLSPSTVHVFCVRTKCSFAYAVENEIVAKNPFSKSVKIPKQQKRDRVLSEYERGIFREYMNNARDATRGRFLLLIMQTGLRLSEAVGIRWENVDFENCVLHVRKQLDRRGNDWVYTDLKSESSVRDIPLTEEATRVLKSQREANRRNGFLENSRYKEFVFLTDNGKPVTQETTRRMIKEFVREYNLEPIKIHSLRHTFATVCAESGMKPNVLQRIMGHGDISTTYGYYVHETINELASEMGKVRI